jgi:hypothetical protein
MSVTVITSTIGRPELRQAIESVRAQTSPARHMVLVNGVKFHEQARSILKDYPNVEAHYLTDNTGDYGADGPANGLSLDRGAVLHRPKLSHGADKIRPSLRMHGTFERELPNWLGCSRWNSCGLLESRGAGARQVSRRVPMARTACVFIPSSHGHFARLKYSAFLASLGRVWF